MIYNFRQGIASYPKTGSLQQFLIKSGNYVTLNVSPSSLVQIIFADHDVDYLLDESITVNNAWGPLPTNTDVWIYWDISTLTGVRTFGFTLFEPTYGPTAPTPVIDQHWFDTTNTTMFVFNGIRWVKKIRVFAAKVFNNTFTPLGTELLTAPFAGSQVGLYGSGYETNASYILYDSHGKPIPKQSGEFLRAVDEFLIQGSHITHVNLESYVVRFMADEPIARYYVGKAVGENHVVVATYHDIQDGVLAVSVEDLTLYATGAFVIQGVITNIDWDWTAYPPGTPLWIKESGNFVAIDPHVSDVLTYPVAKPPVARVLNKTSIVFNQGMGGKGERGLPGEGSGGSTTTPASTTALGIVRISVAPNDSDNPVAVGTNDPRMTDARTPTAHTHPIDDVIGLRGELDAKLNLTGGTMVGSLALAGDPVNPLEAATKQYVDQAIADAANIISVEAGEELTVGTPVYVSNNKVYAATYLTTPNVLGIVLYDVSPTFTADVVTFGPISLPGLMVGAVYYLGEGIITSTPPTNKYVIRLGTAISSNVLVVNVEPSIYLT